jgi:diketogulonate reductase-like aldo/keto reductase
MVQPQPQKATAIMATADMHDIPRIGQGTWQMERDERAAAVAALRRGIDRGLTHIDTAEMYGAGEVERIVGEAIAGRRDELFLVSKVLPSNASRSGTLRACEQSLARLGTDHLDAYLLHWPGDHPLAETIAAFEQLRAQGKIVRWGVSNFDDSELEAAERLAPGAMACNQVLYHLEERAIEHAVIPWCRRHRVPVVGYSPFGSGAFPPERSRGGKALAAVAARHGASARQVALAFLTREPGWLVIPKAGRVEHVEDNAAALQLRLSPDDLAELDTAFPRGRRRAGIPVL